VRGVPKKIFGCLRNITNSAGLRLATKKFGGGVAQVNKIWRGGARWRHMGLSTCISSALVYDVLPNLAIQQVILARDFPLDNIQDGGLVEVYTL